MQKDNLHIAVQAAYNCDASPAQLAQIYVALRDCPEDVKTCAAQAGIYGVDAWMGSMRGVAALFFSVKDVMDADENGQAPNAPLVFDVDCNCVFCASGLQGRCVSSGVQAIDADPLAEQQAQSRATILANELEKFRKTLHSAATEAIATAYTDYLPYIESDTDSNIGHRVQGCVRNLVAGQFKRVGEESTLVEVQDGYGCGHYIALDQYSNVVKPLVDAFPELLKSERIAELESKLEFANRALNRNH